MGVSKKEEAISLDEAEVMIKAYNKDKQRSKYDKLSYEYDIFHIILFILFADQKYPIHGKTRLMKEIFLAYQEAFKQERARVQEIIFIKHKYGPYNHDVEYILDDMAFANYIEVDGRGNSASIRLTPKGKKYIEVKFKQLPKSIQEELKLGRRSWDTNPDLLNYVYTHYSEFLENALLKKRYKEIDWGSEIEENT